jgi:thioesterase superfamily protein 4
MTLKPTEETEGDMPYKEIVTIVDLGNGVDGYPQTCHGGMVATLMDEVCGVLINLNKERHRERLLQSGCQKPPAILGYMTACESLHSWGIAMQGWCAVDLNTTYKKPVPTPGALLCTAKVERQEGRKLYIRATIEDGAGTVYTTGEGLFIGVKPRLWSH